MTLVEQVPATAQPSAPTPFSIPRVVRRVARQPLDDGSTEMIALPVPPRGRDEMDKASWTQSVLPLLGGLGFLGFVLISPSPVFIAVGVLMMLAMVGSSIGFNWDRRRRDQKKSIRDRRRYGQQLALASEKLSSAARRQVRLSQRNDPDAAALYAGASSPSRVWERRPHQGDFLQVRWGVGDAPLRAGIKVPDSGAFSNDPVCQYEMEQLAESARVISGAPLRLDLRSHRWTVLGGDPTRARDLARSIIGQIATWHGPDDVRLLIASAPSHVDEWRWVRWLPHVRWCEAELPGGSLLTTDAARLQEALVGIATTRAASLPQADQYSVSRNPARATGPHIIVVLDGIGFADRTEAIAALTGPQLGITVVEVSVNGDRWEPPWVDQLLSLDDAGGVLRGPDLLGPSPTDAEADRLDVVQAEILSRQLAPWRLPGQRLTEAGASLNIGEILGFHDLANLSREEAWQPMAASQELVVPLGATGDGQIVELDLKESALGGTGPHGLVVGATGSGKSELLRTVVTGLALTHPPERLAFVLVDFKGGATFSGLSDLPHVAGIITNLSDDAALIDRTHAALRGELQRRQELLSQAGGVVNIMQYRAVQAGTPDLDPLPTLVVVIDEFSELIAACPEFIETFVAIGRLGRSLGLHLMLASQRLEEGRLKGLESHLSYRIVLRTFNAVDSSIALGSRDAYYLPARPGSAYFKAGTSELYRFQAAYVSAPFSASAPEDGPAPIAPFDPVMPDGPELLESEDHVDDASSHASASHANTLMSYIVDRLRDDDRRTHQIWLPPLDSTITLSQVAGTAVKHPQRGLVLTGWPSVGKYKVPLGIADIPEEQRVEVVAPDLDGPGGSILLAGAAQTGKSTFVREMVLSLALTHAPTEVAIYIVDLGGGRLAPLEGLPHVGCVAGRSNPELVTRVIQHVRNLLDEREEFFKRERIAGMADFRQRRRDGAYPDQTVGDLFVMIDGANEIRRQFETLVPSLADLTSRGPGLGVHTVLTSSRLIDLRSQLTDNFATRFELCLNDPIESMFGRQVARSVSKGIPGRGIMEGGRIVQFLLPSLRDPSEGASGDAASADAELQSLVEQVAASWTGPVVPPVRTLPLAVSLSDLPPNPDDGIPLGIGEPDLTTVTVALANQEPHLAVLGDARSGKSTVLVTCLRSLTTKYSADEAGVYLIDYRLGLLDVVPEKYLKSYASSATSTKHLVDGLVAILEERQPPSGISAVELRARSWWDGPELYLVVDDYDLVAVGMDNPLASLTTYLPKGHELGFHVVVARKVNGAMRALMDPVVGRIKEFGNPAVILSGDRNEGVLFHDVRASRLPPGRAMLARGDSDPRLFQVAHVPEALAHSDDLAEDVGGIR